jgi:cell division protein FtsL
MAVLHIRPLNRDLPKSADTSSSKHAQAPTLRLVKGRPRWPAVVGSSLIVFVMVAMLGAAIFHTQLAERQLEIDDLEREVRVERDRFDQLRLQRAVLRSPERIATEATLLGMVTGETSDFVAVDPMELAMQLAAAGVSTDQGDRSIGSTDPLDQFSDVKSVSAEQE